MRALVLAALLLGGCNFDATFGTGYQCGAGDMCPSGQSCVDGTCRATVVADAAVPPDDGGGNPDPDAGGNPDPDAGGNPDPDAGGNPDPDAGSNPDPDAAVPIDAAEPDAPPACGTGGVNCSIDTLVDDFAAAPLGPAWDAFTSAGCTVSETGGALQIAFTGAANAFCTLAATALYDASTGSVTVDTAGFPGRPQFVNYVQLAAFDDTDRIEFQFVNTTLRMNNIVNDAVSTLATVTYGSTHRFWRLRGTGTQLVIETGSDGTSFTPRATVTPSFSLETALFTFGAGTLNAQTAVTWTLPGVNAS